MTYEAVKVFSGGPDISGLITIGVSSHPVKRAEHKRNRSTNIRHTFFISDIPEYNTESLPCQ
jgi:hypothetical protein